MPDAGTGNSESIIIDMTMRLERRTIDMMSKRQPVRGRPLQVKLEQAMISGSQPALVAALPVAEPPGSEPRFRISPRFFRGQSRRQG